jgi:DNA-binding transcriptional ArsR family regulator
MGTVRTKATKSGPKASRSPQNGSRPGTRLEEAATLLKDVGDPVCLTILALAGEESSLSEIGAAIAQDPSKIRGHLATLRKDGLVAVGRRGEQDLYSLTDRGRRVLDLVRWLVYVEPTHEGTPTTTPIDPALLVDVGGIVDDPEAWFRTPNVVFEGRRPIDLLGTPDEPRLRDRIEAAKYGMFS